MIDILRQHIIRRLGRDTDNLDNVLAHFNPLHLKRNEYLLKLLCFNKSGPNIPTF